MGVGEDGDDLDGGVEEGRGVEAGDLSDGDDGSAEDGEWGIAWMAWVEGSAGQMFPV